MIGPWTVAEDSIYRTNKKWGGSDGLYFGTSGLSLGSDFKVDASGTMTAKGATISGTINATDLQLGGVSIQTKLQAIMAQIDAITDSLGNVTGLTVGGTSMRGGEMYVDGAGGLQFTPSSSAPEGYATELSGAAVRIRSTSGDIFIQNAGKTASIQLRADGTIKFVSTGVVGVVPVFG